MHEFDVLKDLVIVLGTAALVVAVLRRFRVPSIAGFIVSGALTGPTALRLIDDTKEVEVLAEIGVILLLFGIGLELSLDRLKRLWQAILLGGGIQVTITIVVAGGVANGFGLPVGASVFIGCVVAVSSTAVVLRGLSSRGELEAPHGRLAVGILVFQDLCVVPMILAVPFLAGQGGSALEIITTVGTAVAILVGVLAAASVVMPRLLSFVAGTRERDLFILSVFLICFGIAWVVSLAGISLALGAFLAGLVVAGSEFRHQALSDLIPAREVFASLFFVSVGMLLDVNDVLNHWYETLGLLVAILVGKFIIVFITALILRLPTRVAVLSGAALCQVGEFSFVLLSAAGQTDLLTAQTSHNLLVAIILSMLLTPLGLAFGPHLAAQAANIPWLNRRLGASPPGVDEPEPKKDHVVLVGYAMAGRAVCKALRGAGIPYVAVDSNPDNVRVARSLGIHAVLGDVTHVDVLEELSYQNARLIVLSINDFRATELAIRLIRQGAPNTPVIVRTSYEMDRDILNRAGATQVVTAEATSSEALVQASMAALP